MSAPLTNDQKRYLSQLATRAFNRQTAMARGSLQTATGQTAIIPPGMSYSAAVDEYRRVQVIAACGKAGLRCCDQNDYKLVEGHFQELLGNSGAAFNAQVRAATETRRLVEFKITAACEEFGFSVSYANKICTAQNHGRTLEQVEEKQLWNVFYTIRNRGNARKRVTQQNPEMAMA